MRFSRSILEDITKKKQIDFELKWIFPKISNLGKLLQKWFGASLK